ncbi:MAG: N-formylglutamate deformylase [Planctomycetota bacterium]
MTDTPYHVREPEAAPIPLLLSIPHCGTELPPEVAEDLAGDDVAALPDTDWHLERLYDFAPELGIRTIHARYSRYLVDLNRPADGSPLYPGRAETEVVPTTTFDGRPLWRQGRAPDEDERRRRIERYWRPYHARLRAELDALREAHGYALLFDAHSIRSEVPRLFAGRLPGLILGDADGTSCEARIAAEVKWVLEESPFSEVANHPFKGGWITRCFGRPDDRVHALQLEMSQRIYMDEDAPWTYRPELAERLRPVLRRALQTFANEAAAIMA